MRGQEVATPAPSISDFIRHGQQLLSQAGIPNYEQEVRWLLQAALGRSALNLHLDGEGGLSPQEWEQGQSFLARRVTREPLQYILGTQEFCGFDYEVTPSVLIPRPETEILVEVAVQQCVGLLNPVIIDIGTGSGCVAIAIARKFPKAIVYATDLSPQALAVAMRNARSHGVEQRIVFLAGNLLEPLQDIQVNGMATIIVSNPPYIARCDWEGLQPEVRTFEPSVALDGGPDGLAILRRLVCEAPTFLESRGWVNLEVGQGQAEIVMAMAKDCSLYSTTQVFPDEAGIDRVVSLQKK